MNDNVLYHTLQQKRSRMFYMKAAKMVKTLEEALAPKPLIFGLTVGNIRTMNLRGQYAQLSQLLHANIIYRFCFRRNAGQTARSILRG